MHKKQNFKGLVWVGLCLVMTIFSCQDSIIVGTDFLSDDRFEINFADSISLRSYTVYGDSVPTYLAIADSRTYMAGQMMDNEYGTLKCGIYVTLRLGDIKPTFNTTTDPLVLDSVVLSIAYDTLGHYAQSTAQCNVQLYQLRNTISLLVTAYSNTSFETEDTPLFESQRLINVMDSITVIDQAINDTLKVKPHLRLKLDQRFGNLILSENEANKTDTAFTNFIKGFYLDITPQLGSSIIGFNLSRAALLATDPTNKLTLYYTQADTIKRKYEYPISTLTTGKYIHDYTGSTVESFVANVDQGDSLTFIHGLGGLKTVVSFNDLTFFNDKLINKAELELSIAEPLPLFGNYNPPPQLIASYKNSNGDLVLISDIAQLAVQGANYFNIFKGGLNSTTTPKTYRMNITNHLKAALADPTLNSDVYISILNEAETPRRVSLYGAKHSTYPIKLKVNYTKK